MRQLSRRAVFECLLHNGAVSRADLAKATPLSKQTVSEVIDGFERQGWVRPIGRTSGNIGRTAVLYELYHASAFAIGIDLGGSKVSASIADLSGNIVGEITEATHSAGGVAVLNQIARIVDKIEETGSAPRERVKTVALGTPGVVNPITGGIELAPNISSLQTLNVARLLEADLGIAVQIENDVNLAVLGEIWQGCAREAKNVAFIALGSGIGMGLVVDGELVRGQNGAAGEIGFLPIGEDPHFPEAKESGTLEVAVGAAGIIHRYRRHGGTRAANVKMFSDSSIATRQPGLS
jgi:predicted NBD/HSP70 family sugar kinase